MLFSKCSCRGRCGNFRALCRLCERRVFPTGLCIDIDNDYIGQLQNLRRAGKADADRKTSSMENPTAGPIVQPHCQVKYSSKPFQVRGELNQKETYALSSISTCELGSIYAGALNFPA